MSLQPLPRRNEDLPPTQPLMAVAEDRRAFKIGAWIGICCGLALVSGLVVVALTPAPARLNAQAWTPTIVSAPAN